MSEETIELKRVNCPHCRQQLFRHDPDKVIHISIACNHCKAIYEITTKADKSISFRQTREPKFGYVPRYNKGE